MSDNAQGAVPVPLQPPPDFPRVPAQVQLTEGPERQGLLDARAKLLQALGALDRLAYERQKVSPLSADAKEFDPTAALNGVRMSAAALDDILKRLS